MVTLVAGTHSAYTKHVNEQHWQQLIRTTEHTYSASE